eukprot:m.214019 g.214019  ORF g.214019 m.214019 type:complete len:451 (+) comp15581_c0_seq4:1544-2896(+)
MWRLKRSRVTPCWPWSIRAMPRSCFRSGTRSGMTNSSPSAPLPSSPLLAISRMASPASSVSWMICSSSSSRAFSSSARLSAPRSLNTCSWQLCARAPRMQRSWPWNTEVTAKAALLLPTCHMHGEDGQVLGFEAFCGRLGLKRPSEIIILSDKIKQAATNLVLPPILSVLCLVWQCVRFELKLWNNPNNPHFFLRKVQPTLSFQGNSNNDVRYSNLSNHLCARFREDFDLDCGKKAHLIRAVVIADASARFGMHKEKLTDLATVMRHSLSTSTRYYNLLRDYNTGITAQRELLAARGHLETVPILAKPPGESESLAAVGAEHMRYGVFTPKPLPPIPAPSMELVYLLFRLKQLVLKKAPVSVTNSHPAKNGKAGEAAATAEEAKGAGDRGEEDEDDEDEGDDEDSEDEDDDGDDDDEEAEDACSADAGSPLEDMVMVDRDELAVKRSRAE